MKLLILILIVIIPSLACAQEIQSTQPETVDSRSAAMGKTAIMSATGSNAIFSNPSLLATVPDHQVQMGGRLFFGSVSEDFEEIESTARYAPHAKFNHLSYAMPYEFSSTSLKFAFGIGYQTYLDYGVKAIAEEEGAEFTLDLSGGLNTLSPAAAVNFRDRYFLGVSYNKSLKSDISIVTSYEDEDFQQTGELDIETSASYLLVGGVAKLTPELSIGVMYRPKLEWDLEVDGGDFVDPDSPLPINRTGKIEFPALYGIGVSYQASPGILVVGEYQSRPFADYEVNGRPYQPRIDDGYTLRLGTEIQNEIPIRLGVFREAVLSSDAGEDNPLYATGITGGVGIDVGNLILDTALEAGTWRQDLGEGNTYKENLFRLRLSARYVLSTPEALPSTPVPSQPPPIEESDESPADETRDLQWSRFEGGLGLGIPYGVLGGNAQYNATPNLSASLGLGTTVIAGAGWSVGARYALGQPESPIRPRVGAFYGTNAAVQEGFGDSGESFTGLTLGGGLKWMWGQRKRWGLDFDVLYLATSGFDQDEYEERGYETVEVLPGNIRLSFGLRIAH